MHAFWEIVASNALLVTALAVGVALLGRVWKNAAGLHVLWLLVLLKLFTPAIFTIGVPLPVDWAAPASASQRPHSGASSSRDAGDLEAGFGALSEWAAQAPFSESAARLRGADAAAAATVSTVERRTVSWSVILAWAWGIGITVFASSHTCRVLRFRRLLRAAQSPPADVHQMAERIAKRLGLRRAPEILTLPVRLSPLVWSIGGRARVILPAQLFARLDADAREAILVHELAHVGRRDHLVRLLELVATTVFWWHPVVWWACHQLRELEERCCDAAVLEAVSHGPRVYATALVDTLDFLSETKVAVPMGATAARSSASLARRIKMLTQRTTNRLTLRSALVVMLIGLVPMAVAFAAEGQGQVTNPTAQTAEPPLLDKQDEGVLIALNAAGPPSNDTPGGSPATDQPSGPDKPASADLDEEGATIGPVQVEILSDTDVLVVRGQERDVQKVVELIGEIQESAKTDQPAEEKSESERAQDTIKDGEDKGDLDVMDVKFEPIRRGRNVVRVKVQNSSVKDQIFGIDIRAETHIRNWQRRFSDTIKGGETKWTSFDFEILGPIADATSIRLRFYNLASAGEYEDDNCFQETKYYAKDLESREKVEPSQPASVAQAAAVTQAFREFQSGVKNQDYEQAWTVMSNHFKSAACEGDFEEFTARAISEEGTSPMTTFLNLHPESVTKSGDFLVLHATDKNARFVIYFVEEDGEWRIYEGGRSAGEPPKENDTAQTGAGQAAEKRSLEIIVAKHVILLDDEILTPPELEERLREQAAAGPIWPRFHFTTGAEQAGKAEAWHDRALDLHGELRFSPGFTIGSVSHLASMRYDGIRTADDLRPDPSRRIQGTVRLADGRAAVGATVVIREPSEWESLAIYLHDGGLRSPIEEVWTKTDQEGRFAIYPAKEKFSVAVLHADGFAAADAAQLVKGEPIALEAWATIELTLRRSADRGIGAYVTVNASPAPDGVPLVFDGQLSTGDASQVSSGLLMPSGSMTVSTLIPVSKGFSVAVSHNKFEVRPGEAKRIELGPPTKEDIEWAERHSDPFGVPE